MKKDNLAPLALRIQNIRCQEYFGMPLVLSSRMMKLLTASSAASFEPCFRQLVGEHEKVEYNDSNKNGKKKKI